jgi:hypothetical protein
MSDLYLFQKNVLVKLLITVQENTRKECAKNANFIKSSIDEMDIEGKMDIASFISPISPQTPTKPAKPASHACDCFFDVDKWCKYCDY